MKILLHSASFVFFPFLISLAVIAAPARNADAQTDIYVRGSEKLIPLALPELCLEGGGSAAPQEIPKTIARDLDLSGYFEIVNPKSYIEAPGKCGGAESVVPSDWSVLGVEGVVRGTVAVAGSGLKIRLYLYDVQKQAMVLGKEYDGDASQVSKIAHRFANEILKFFTGEYGPFGTSISFSSRIGRFKELFVMDMDGSNLQQLTNDRGLAISSSWHPNGRELVFTSYRNRIPDLFMIDLTSRQVRQITRNDSLEVGAKFPRGLPGADSMLAAVSSGRDSEIVRLSLSGVVAQRLTPPNNAIDVSPEWSPDNSAVTFCSNRAGGPQIYTMDAGGGNAKRISFVRSNYCTSPAWSPKGDKIAFVCLADRGNQIFVTQADGTQPQQLTSYGNNEEPDWSPDGRYLVFATTFGKGSGFSLALMHADGSGVKQLTTARGGDTDPSWGPLIP